MIAAGSLMADGSQGLDRFVRSLAAGSGDLPSGSTYAACLAPLLKALGWRGESRHLIEAMPHCATDLDLVDLRNIVANLGFRSRALRVALDDLDPRLMPCLFVPLAAPPMVVLSISHSLNIERSFEYNALYALLEHFHFKSNE